MKPAPPEVTLYPLPLSVPSTSGLRDETAEGVVRVQRSDPFSTLNLGSTR